MGKGSVRRPCQIPQRTFRERWDQTFGHPAEVGAGPGQQPSESPSEGVEPAGSRGSEKG